ncbi:MAG TPA: D-alanyl-D-alanine carboxypeptidase family protein [Patescibacteria group bacterium]|nr:D-alanyl-D-alanine carboxypeptidase family protein [Patescibacteria group bacterium]
MAKKKKRASVQKIPWFITNWDKILFLIFVGIFILLSPGQNIYTIGKLAEPISNPTVSLNVPTPAPYPTNSTGVYPGSEVTATGVVVLDINSGVFMYKRNADVSLSPASTTKILTALVALDSYNLDDVVTIKTATVDGQVMGLVPGEQMTVENLLYGALIYSGNDAAWAIADHYPGGEPAFVDAMNKKAQALHLDHSTFTNPVGFDDPNHKMTPIDLAHLGSVALQNKTIAKMVAIPEITISDVTHTYFYPLKNVNELLGKIPGVGGIKTGWTEEAGENLMTLVDRNGHKVITVVLHSQDRFGDTEKLINWIFANYQWVPYGQSQ